MGSLNGSNLQTLKQKNRAMVLRMILLGIRSDRSGIARELNLTKTTITNIVAELLQEGIIQEVTVEDKGGERSLGRKSVQLRLAESAPLVCGIMLQRQTIMAVLTDLNGQVVKLARHSYEGIISLEEIKNVLQRLYQELSTSVSQRIFAVGISALGPIDVDQGLILQPRRFYMEKEDFPIVDFLKSVTGLPVFLVHDVSAAALAEKFYGNALWDDDFIYIGLIHGLGAGFFLRSRLYDGENGQNGELGHVSINYQGEQCECGRRGCVEQYIDFEVMKKNMRRYERIFPGHAIYEKSDITFFDVVLLADQGDALSLLFLEEYCQYLSCALSALVLSLGIHHIYISNILEAKNHVFEDMLETKLKEISHISGGRSVVVKTSKFGLEAPLYGASAIIMDKVFQGKLYFN